MGHLLALGCGYSARRLAKELINEGWTVSETARNAERAEELRALGISPLLFDGTRPLAEDDLGKVTHIVNSIPPGPQGDLSLSLHMDSLLTSKSLT